MVAMTLKTVLIVTLLIGFIDCDEVTRKECAAVNGRIVNEKCIIKIHICSTGIETPNGCVEKYDAECLVSNGMKVGNLCVHITEKPVTENKPVYVAWQTYPREAFVHPKTPYDEKSDNGFKPLTVSENYYVQSVCGQATKTRTRIMNGNMAAKEQFPWAVSLENGCTGVLISPRHVLTALHCVAANSDNSKWIECPKNEHVVNKELYYGGVCYREDNINCPQGMDMKVAKVTRVIYPNDHPEGTARFQCLYENDIALLLLDKDIEFNDYVKPICMSKLRSTDFVNVKNVGFGYKSRDDDSLSRLRYMDSKIIGMLGISEVKSQGIQHFNVTPSICPGDSGGPLQGSINGSSRTYLAGIHSRGIGKICNPTDKGLVNSFVPAYVDWLCMLTGVCELK